ncbi:uncharacterized protein TrAFT101_001703 [Trichoderma asperellum]|uniref:uncharacterized protein n=1 Tax=Trichoderma asperellum TaxID=101201 RepID=UPI003317983C|nr:hypothetical protein TrAFT101_001703 [Trichoderma asperellum]
MHGHASDGLSPHGFCISFASRPKVKMRGGIWLGSSGSTGNEMLPPLLLVRFILPFEAVVGTCQPRPAATVYRTKPNQQWRVGTQCRTLFSPSIACDVLIGRTLPGIPVKRPGRDTIGGVGKLV